MKKLVILLISLISICGCSSSDDIPTYEDGYKEGYDEGYLLGCNEGYDTGWYDCYYEVAKDGEFSAGAKEALSWIVDSIPLSTFTKQEFEEFIFICDYVGKMDEDYIEDLKNQYEAEIE